MDCFKDMTLEKTRSAVGRFGITGKAQTQPIKNLSDGLRSRVVFAKLSHETPNMVGSLLVKNCERVAILIAANAVETATTVTVCRFLFC